MTRSWSIALLLVALLVTFALEANAKALAQPEEILPNEKGVTKVSLTVRAHRVSIPLVSAADDDYSNAFFEYTGRFYFLDDSNTPMLPGPTLHAKPGGKISLTLKNELGEEVSNGTMNTFHHPNTTNVHFHGLHSDPKIDNPFVTITTGQELSYKISFVRDYEPGFHWYHAHCHGSTYEQVMGGLFGGIVVDDGTWLAAPQHPFRDYDTKILMIHLYRLGVSSRCDGTPMTQLDDLIGSKMPSRPQIVDRAGRVRRMPADLYLVNGQHRPTVDVTVDRPTVLRMAYAAGSCHLNISLPPHCSFHTFAADGIQFRRTKEAVHGWLYFTTATRLEAVVMCDRAGFFPIYHSDAPDDVLLYLSAKQSSKKVTPVEFPVTLPKYTPDYLYLGSSRHVKHQISFSQEDLPSPKPYYLIGQGKDCSSLKNDSMCFYEPFAGSKDTDAAAYHGFTVPLNSVVTAHIYGDPTDKVPHPLHFHVNHFQFLSFEPRPGGLHENQTMAMYGVLKNQFRDTIPILDGVTVIRWSVLSYTGEVVYHCHALHHEDRGMMSSYLVYPEWNPPQPFAWHRQTDRLKGHAALMAFLAFFLVVAAAALVIVGVRSLCSSEAAHDTLMNIEPTDQTRSCPTSATEEAPLMQWQHQSYS